MTSTSFTQDDLSLTLDTEMSSKQFLGPDSQCSAPCVSHETISRLAISHRRLLYTHLSLHPYNIQQLHQARHGSGGQQISDHHHNFTSFHTHGDMILCWSVVGHHVVTSPVSRVIQVIYTCLQLTCHGRCQQNTVYNLTLPCKLLVEVR